VFRDLTTGIVVGFALGGIVFIRRMSEAASIEATDDAGFAAGVASDARRVTYRLRGPYFFGAAAQLGGILDQIADHPSAFVIDVTEVPFFDSSGARAFELLARKLVRKGGQLYILGAMPEVQRALIAGGALEPLVRFVPDAAAVDTAEAAR